MVPGSTRLAQGGHHVAFMRSQQPCFPKPYVATHSAAYNLGKLRTWQSLGILERYLFLWFPGDTTGWFWKLRREWVSWRHQKCLSQFWKAFSQEAKAHLILSVACLRADHLDGLLPRSKGPPDTISSMSTSLTHLVLLAACLRAPAMQ